MIDFTCDKCGTRGLVKNELSGHTITCKNCGGKIVITSPKIQFIKETNPSKEPLMEPINKTLSNKAIDFNLKIPDYWALQSLALIISMVGYIAMAIASILAFIIIATMIEHHGNFISDTSGGLLLFSLFNCITAAVVLLAFGQFLYAFRDMARNSWYLILIKHFQK